MDLKLIRGHCLAALTILLWGTTFISTKILLIDFTPIEILFFRFVIGLFALAIVYPKPLGWCGWKRELTFMAAGLSGISLYYLLENIALTMTYTSHVGIIVSTAPFFTALAASYLTHEEKLNRNFFIGFIFAIGGIALISLSGSSSEMDVNPLGNILALLAAVTWAFYSIFSREIGSWGYHPVQTTRRIFTYGLIFLLPTLFFMDFSLGFERFAVQRNLFNILYLGLGASALCFVTWNSAITILGSVKTSSYIYAVPVINIIGASIILHEEMTATILFGTTLAIAGLCISEMKPKNNEALQEPATEQ